MKTKTLLAVASVVFFLAGPVEAETVSEKIFAATGMTKPELPAKGNLAVEVTFDGSGCRMEFRLSATYRTLTENGIGYSDGWAETFDRKNCEGCCEGIMDGRRRYARIWIEKQSPARIVVRARTALCDIKGRIAHTDVPSDSPYGPGDWADEWYTIYTDGTYVRTVTIYTGLAPKAGAHWGRKGLHPFESQESTVRGPDGHRPVDDIELNAITLIRMDGKAKKIGFKPYPPCESLLPGANIQVVNLKSRNRPFTIVPPGDVEIKPYYGPDKDRLHLDKTVFVTWGGPNRIPTEPEHYKHGYATALTHIINWNFFERTDKSITRVYLCGMTNASAAEQQAGELVPLAKSWLSAPRLKIDSKGYKSLGYDMKQRAYVIQKEKAAGDKLTFELAAGEKSPAINPAFVIKGWGTSKAQLRVDGKPVAEGDNLRIGYEKSGQATDLVIWLREKAGGLMRFEIRGTK